ncbi:MAG TPA: hypothetical protein VFE08_14485 [Candidatus Sulfotelmatobacter sp.]|jgi:hypothetical protein|nr:hypothetical protein [Candidatus Sulfotelmatobacter sp.]
MARTNRTQRNRNGNRHASPRMLRVIASQVSRLADADVYALTFTSDRQTRYLAMQEAHARAERYALNND